MHHYIEGVDWHSSKVGTTGRALAFVHLIVSRKWYNTTAMTETADLGKGQVGREWTQYGKRWTMRRQALEHAFPQSSFLRDHEGRVAHLDHVGKLEFLEIENAMLNQKCAAKLGAEKFKDIDIVHDKTAHPQTEASVDVLGTSAAMKKVLNGADPRPLRAVCAVYYEDYANFGYDMPAKCSGEASWNRGLSHAALGVPELIDRALHNKEWEKFLYTEPDPPPGPPPSPSKAQEAAVLGKMVVVESQVGEVRRCRLTSA